jgi:hypothetical protein
MDILVKQFSVKHEGKIYQAGDVIRGLSEEDANRISSLAHLDVQVLEGGDEVAADTGGKLPSGKPKVVK